MNCEAVGNRDVLRLKFTRQLPLRNPPGDYPARRSRRIDESNPGFSSRFVNPRNLSAYFDLLPRLLEFNAYGWEVLRGKSHSGGNRKAAFADVKEQAAVVPAQIDETDGPDLLPGMNAAFACLG